MSSKAKPISGKSVPVYKSKNAPTLSMTALKMNLKAGKTSELQEQKYLVTPAMATQILKDFNATNRTLNDTHLRSIMGDIKNGNWVDGTGSMISFERSGQLIDGQHRLAAIIKTNTPLALSFKFGLDEAAKRVIDTGRKRTHVDYITMTEGKGAKYKMERASVARLLFGFLRDQKRPHTFTNNNKPTQSDLCGVAEEFGDEIAQAVGEILPSGHVGKVVIGSYAAFVALIAGQSAHSDKVNEFFELLGSGANLSADNPIMVVRNRLMMHPAEFRSQKNKDQTIGLLIKGWNLWVNGETISNKMRSPEHLIPVSGLTKMGKHPLYE